MLRRLITGTAAAALATTAAIALTAGAANAGNDARGNISLSNGTVIGTWSFSHAADSLTVCDVRDDEYKLKGSVSSVHSEGEEVWQVLEFEVWDDTVDGACVTAAKDLEEGRLHVVGARAHLLDGTPASWSGADWAQA